MEKFTRKERLVYLTSIFIKNPGKLYSFSEFCDKLSCAKSTVSEDISIVSSALLKSGMGELRIKAGQGGGVKFLPFLDQEDEKRFLEQVAAELSDPNRILPGGFIYTIDVLLNTETLNPLGEILASKLSHFNPDYIVTAETKGISVALTVANIFRKPVVIARRLNKITEGSIVTINYLSGTARRLQTISIAKRAIAPKSTALVIDDFIAGGGTVRAICDMMREFDVTVLGIGCVIATKYPERKKISDFISLFTLNEVDEENQKINLTVNL